MTDFDQLEEVFRRWMNLDADPDLLRIVFSVVVANRIDGNPVWVILIGKSGSGKTTLLSALEKANEIKPVSTVTPASLLSGYQMDGVNDSLLYTANGKVIVIKDFSTILKLPKETRDQVFAIFRDAYDGSVERSTGKGPLVWKGKIGMLTAATAALEEERQTETLIGERFINVRSLIGQTGSSDDIILSMLKSSTKLQQKRDELSDASARYLDNLTIPTEHNLPRKTISLIQNVSKALVKNRTGVLRDWTSKEIRFPVEVQELPTRIMGQLTLMALGFKYTGASEDAVDRVVIRMLRDGTPYLRLRVLQAIQAGRQTQTDIGAYAKVSQSHMNRILDEMQKLDILKFTNKWSITDDITREATQP